MGFNIEYTLTMVFYKMLMLHNYPLYINKGANCQRCATTFHIFTRGITPLPPPPSHKKGLVHRTNVIQSASLQKHFCHHETLF